MTLTIRARILLFLAALTVIAVVDPPKPVLFGVGAYFVLMFPAVPSEPGRTVRRQ